MATHFSILAWRMPRTEEPGGLQFMVLNMAAQHTEKQKYLMLCPAQDPVAYPLGGVILIGA